MTRSYSELVELDSFEDRFAYLALKAVVGDETFGVERYLNQQFYHSPQWRSIRLHVRVRDEGCDLGIRGREIPFRPYVHHMNPITVRDVTSGDASILDPEFLITTTHQTHNAIHYGDERHLPRPLVTVRSPGDTTLWGKERTQDGAQPRRGRSGR